MISLQELLTLLIVGLVAGWLGGVIMKGRGFGVAGNLVVGVIGALLGGLVFRLLGLGAYSLIGRIISALVGSLLFLWLLRFIKK